MILVAFVVLTVTLGAFVLHPIFSRASVPWPEDPGTDQLYDRHDAALLALRELDLERDLGKLNDEDYFPLRERYAHQALALLRLIEQQERDREEALERAIAARRGHVPVKSSHGSPMPQRGPRMVRAHAPRRLVIGSTFAAILVIVSAGLLFATAHSSSTSASPWTKSPIPGAAALAFDPSQPDRLLIASRQLLAVSNNGGKTWIQHQLPSEFRRLESLFPLPSGKGVGAILSDGALVQSQDGGQTWQPLHLGTLPNGIASLAIVPGVHPLLVAATSRGVEVSTDEGKTWALANGLVNGLLPQTPVHAVVYAATADQSIGPQGQVFHGLLLAATNDGLYTSRDGGGSWFAAPLSVPLRAVAVNQHSADTVIALDNQGNLYFSRDAGQTWIHQ
ncbi:MAG: hypothetical protein M1298_05165 [Chloroflexi bacterium]|nr:hypothetical protein [Chloroflexota bacterium]